MRAPSGVHGAHAGIAASRYFPVGLPHTCAPPGLPHATAGPLGLPTAPLWNTAAATGGPPAAAPAASGSFPAAPEYLHFLGKALLHLYLHLAVLVPSCCWPIPGYTSPGQVRLAGLLLLLHRGFPPFRSAVRIGEKHEGGDGRRRPSRTMKSSSPRWLCDRGLHGRARSSEGNASHHGSAEDPLPSL